MAAHARLEARADVVLEGVCRHGQDDHVDRVLALERADVARGGKAVHHGHHDVHEDEVVGAQRGLREGPHGLGAVARAVDDEPQVAQHHLRDLEVELVVLDEKRPLAGKV